MFVKIRVDFGGQQKMHNMVLVGSSRWGCVSNHFFWFYFSFKLESWGHDPI